MTKATSLIKCHVCGHFNENTDYCTQCGALISHEKRRALRHEEFKQEQIALAQWKLENPTFVERLKKHPNFIAKGIGWILYSAIVVVSAIGGAIAWFVAMVAAG